MTAASCSRPTIRLLRASSTGGSLHSPTAAAVPPSSSPPSSSSSTLSSSTSFPAPSFSSSSHRPATLRARFSPAHIRINTQSRHSLRDPSTRIKEEEEGKDDRAPPDEPPHPPPSTLASPSPSTNPASRSRLQLTQLRPSIHTGALGRSQRSVMMSASPAVTPSSTSPRSSFLPTTRPHAHTIAFSSPLGRLAQHPEDAGLSYLPHAPSSRRNSLSRYTPIGNEESRGGRDLDDPTSSSRSPHLFSPPASGGAAAHPAVAVERPAAHGSWRHRRPQSLTAPFSSNAIAATTTTATAVSASAQLSSAQSVSSPSVHTVTLPSASSASATPGNTASPGSSNSLSSSSSLTSSYRTVSPLINSLSPSLISALTLVSDPPHPIHFRSVPEDAERSTSLPHPHASPDPPGQSHGGRSVLSSLTEGRRERKNSVKKATKARQQRASLVEEERKEGKERPVVHAQPSPPAPSPPARSPPAASPSAADERKDPTHAAVRVVQAKVVVTGVQSQSPRPINAALTVSALTTGVARLMVLSPPASSPPPLPPSSSSSSPSPVQSPAPPVYRSFSPIFALSADDAHAHSGVRIAVRQSGRGGSVVLMAGEEGRGEDGGAVRGRGGSVPLSHWRDFDRLAAIHSIEVSQRI